MTMKAKSIGIDVLGTISKDLVMIMEGLQIGRLKPSKLQTTLLRSAKILTRVLEISKDLLTLSLQGKNSARARV